ncbi:MAG: ATP-binding protein [Leptolyngbyaceae cyanobacterium]
MHTLLHASLHVTTDLNELSQLLDWFDQFNVLPLPHNTWLECQLVLVEGFTNAVRHAHRDYPVETLIQLDVTLLEHQVEIRIWDQGAPFNLEQTLKELSQEMDYYAEGGRGLKLMRRIADSLSYTREKENCNCLLIIKRY